MSYCIAADKLASRDDSRPDRVPPVDTTVIRVALVSALGLFLGLERERSQKPAGIRTFPLISLLGAVFTITDGLLLGSVVPLGTVVVGCVVKMVLTAPSSQRSFARHVTVYSTLVLAVSVAATLVIVV